MLRNARGCGVFRLGERCFSLRSILAAAASPAHKQPYGKYCAPSARLGNSEDCERRFEEASGDVRNP